MRLTTFLVLASLVLGACSDDDGDDLAATSSSSSSTTAAAGDPERPAWMAQFGDTISYDGEHDGEHVWINVAGDTIYLTSCDAARRLTAEGGPYGPTGGRAGHAYICQD